ncbi:MAG: MMPL family transporter [Spirochaetales bacterium]|nr:MMPL family transporter [Spirochaetales bacterium]
MRIQFTTDIADYFVDDDPVLSSQKRFINLFDQNEFVAVLVESDNVFSPDTLETVNSLGLRLMEDVPFASAVTSIASVNPVLAGGHSFHFDDEVLTSSAAELEEIREVFSGIASFRGQLFSDDMHQAWIILSLTDYPSEGEWDGRQTPRLTAGTAAYNTVQVFRAPEGIRLTATGVPVYAHRKEQEMLADFMKILLLGAVISVVMTAFILRNGQAIIGALVIIFFSVASVFAWYGWSGQALDNAFMAVPILLTMGLSIGYSVHITHFFELYYAAGLSRRKSVFKAVLETWRPILFTVVTTAAAMLTFMLVDIEPIRWVVYQTIANGPSLSVAMTRM